MDAKEALIQSKYAARHEFEDIIKTILKRVSQGETYVRVSKRIKGGTIELFVDAGYSVEFMSNCEYRIMWGGINPKEKNNKTIDSTNRIK